MKQSDGNYLSFMKEEHKHVSVIAAKCDSQHKHVKWIILQKFR